MTRLVVHIGAGKCGSSAIQKYLKRNASALRQIGVLVPSSRCRFDGEITGDQIWFFEEQRPFDLEKQERFLHTLLKLKEHSEIAGASTIVLSAENLINPSGVHSLFEGVGAYFDVHVIVYIRRQDDYVVSAWQQWYAKKFKDIHSWLEGSVGVVANWDQWLLPWEGVFPNGQITVRLFSAEHLINGDVVDDFCATAQIDQETLTPMVGPMNRSFDEALVRLASSVNDVFESIHDNAFYEAMVHTIGKDAFKKTKGSAFLSLSQRHALLSAYEECNHNIRRKYFPDFGNDRPLFPPPTAADVVEADEDKLRADEIAMLVRAVYGISRILKKNKNLLN